MTKEPTILNRQPRRRRDDALKRREELVKQYIADGMSKEDAETQALEVMRENPKGDWRRG